jgi:flagellar biosynthetic protein FliQ
MPPDDMHVAVDLGREALLLSLKLSLPLLVVGLLVGVLVSIVQAATQVQEQTLTFLPKILAVAATLFAVLPWLLGELSDYTTALIRDMGRIFL